MKKISLICEDGETESLRAMLKGHVFHLTTAAAFAEIEREGKVLHNRENRFALNTSSERSFGRLMGYVCLFDLRHHNQDVLDEIQGNYNFLGPSWFEIERDAGMASELTYLILHEEFYNQLIPNHAAFDHLRDTGEYLHYVPHGETWIKESLPLGWIDTVIIVTFRRSIGPLEQAIRASYRKL
jgi:hypothetical protein